jgi:hypothetical protein
LCVEVSPLQRSRERGQAAQWAVAAWAAGGNVPDAVIRLGVTPAGSGTASFSFGCGADDGSSSCDLGAVDATSAKRQLQAQVTIPETAADVTAVRLTATGTATGLRTDPAASASIAVIAPPVPVGATAPLPVATLPGISAPDPTLSPGGDASRLFPALSPGTSPSPGQSQAEAVRQAANTTLLPGPANPAGAEVAGLAALALAFILAVTRVTVRRPAPAAGVAPGTASSPQAPAATGGQQADPPDPDPEPDAPEA